MAVKFPLEMKDGVQVRNITELRTYFDIEKVVGYFLDGRLKKWLDARWYEEESEAISKLDEKDLLLTEHLCEIFGVEYADKKINTDEIAARNARILKLKQYTDNDEIINSVDIVAFDQEELAELYEKGVEKIYLCEGEFRIPNSKKHLTYYMIGNVDVIGIDKDKEKKDVGIYIDGSDSRGKSIISQELADVIGERKYAESENMVVWVKNKEYDNKDKGFFDKKKVPVYYGNLNVWDKASDEYFSVDIIDNPYRVRQIEFIHNKLVVGDSKLSVYEISGHRFTCIYEQRYRGDFSISKDKIAFRPIMNSDVGLCGDTFGEEVNRSIVILDISTLEEVDTGIVPKDENMFQHPEPFCLWDNYLYFVKNNSICKYNIVNKKSIEKIFEQSNLERSVIVCGDNDVFLRYYNERTSEGKLIGFGNNGIIEYVDQVSYYDYCYISKKLELLVLHKYNGFYILNMKTKKSEFFPIEYKLCDVVKIVGNYLYYRTHKDKYPTYRVDLLNISNGAIKIKE